MGFGRLGSFTGPLVFGVLIARGWQIGGLFTLLGAVALCPGAVHDADPPGSAAPPRPAGGCDMRGRRQCFKYRLAV